WHVGVRTTGAAASGTAHVQELVEAQALVYVAPEALLGPDHITEAADVFSLGAIAYHLFSGRVPAASTLELAQTLRAQKGLKLSAVIDGVGPSLEELVQWSTHPDVLTRVGSVTDFLALLEDVEEELTAPEGQMRVDPVHARRGDRLEHGFVVERILGRGSSAVALLAQKGGEEYVLKVARDQDHNVRLREEGEVLKKLRSEFIVGLHDVLDMHGRMVLVLDKAGDETLATRLRQEGRCGLDLLQRFGEDLLAAVDSLERAGIAHRDIKPDNIAVRVSRQRLQLVLFDFSLSRAPAEHIHVGTVPYLEPFLSCRQPPRWDQAAERYAASVTLYEMATGVLPRWGDGKSDPALTEAALVLAAEQFEPTVREGLVAFFQRALHRDPQQRFDNAEEILRAWREVFRHAERQMVTTPAGQEVRLDVRVSEVQSDTLVAMLGLSTRAMHALDRVNVITVRELLAYPVGDLQFMRGVGHKTRREILAMINTLRERFPNLLSTDDVASTQHDEGDVSTLSLDALRRRVVGSEVPGRAGKQLQMRLSFLGLDVDDTTPPLSWPSQIEVASYLQVPRGRLSQIMTTERQRWVRDRAVTALRQQIVQEVQAAGGVMTIDELSDALLATRATTLAEELTRRQLASALVRAAYEAEQTLVEPRVSMRRVPSAILIACTTDLAAYAERLGRLADQLAEEDPLPSPVRLFQRLYVEPQPECPPGCQPLTHERLLRLAAHASQGAAVSTRQELYPRGMSALRALRLGLGALTGLGLDASDKDGSQLSPTNVRQRIAARYPEAEPPPDHPHLGALLQEVGLDVRWDEAAGAYRRPASLESTGSSMPQRHSTAASARRTTLTPEVAEARLFEERLQHAYQDGAFLVLTVRPSQLRRCEAELLHRFHVLRHSCDRLLLTHLCQQATRLRIDWQVVREADGAPPGSRDWNNLLRLVSMVAPAIEAELLAAIQPVLLVHPGLLARYGQMGLLERLRDQVGRRGVCPGLWVLVAADEQSELPLLDGQAIPLLTPGQRAPVPQAWLENAHRAAGAAERR
ncbi:MAG TPA: BREX system serine/threonine kinase PglW, partial [Candidatus Saccharimonadia bacterium]|nr:BREX system serine/threonine kinase PglW [Candidatus Saccharimonadia bacterium]